MDLSKLILAGLLTSGSHTMGHMEQGNRLGVPMKLNIKDMTEEWETDNKEKRLKIHGAGFRTQDETTRAMNKTDMNKEMNLANAIYKIGYLFGSHKMGGAKTPGDIELMADDTGSKLPIQLSLVGSILSDLHRMNNPDRNWDLQFWQSNEGTPGLMYRREF